MVEESNLIDEFKETFVDIYDTQPIFIEGLAYWLTSATLGYFATMPTLKRYYKKPNIYVIFSSVPWATRRSTVVTLGRRIYREIWKRFLDSVGEDNINEKVEPSIIREFTVEGGADWIQKSELNHYNIIAPEMGAMWSRMGQKNLSGIKQLLSQLYDGMGYTQYLSQLKKKENEYMRIIPEKLHFTLLGDLQEPQIYFDEFDLTQGIMRRILLIYEAPEDIDVESTKSEYMDITNDKSLDDEIKKISKKFVNRMLYLKEGVDVYIDPTSENYILQKEKQIKQEIKESINPVLSLHKPIEIEMLKKLPVLRIIASDKQFIDERYRELQIEDELKETKTFLRRAFKNLPDAIEKIVIRTKRPIISEAEAMKQKIIKKIVKEGDWISNLSQKMNATMKELQPYIDDLRQESRIYILRVQEKYKPTIYYTTNSERLDEQKKKYEEEGLTTSTSL